MRTADDSAIIVLQMALNKKMYDIGGISHDMYTKTNDALIARLVNQHRTGTT